MPVLVLLREIAAALRAGDMKTAFKKFVELLNLIAGTMPTNPVALSDLINAARESAALKASDSGNANAVADQIEALCAEMEGESGEAKVMANGELVKKLFQLIVKLLPLLLAGL